MSEALDGKFDFSKEEPSTPRWRWGILPGVCALVIGVYAYTAHSGFVTSSSLDVADNYYNLLVQGFRAGQLNLKKEVPVGLAQLADPYDPSASSAYPVLDLSYYKGKLYLYFGVTPAVVLFWPYAVLTGGYLSQKDAALIFCVVGFLANAGLLCALWRRYFAQVSVWVVAAAMLALGLATLTPFLLARCDVWEVSISCGYALTMLALAAIWKAFHEPERRAWWLAAASLAYGLAVGARPTLLFGGVILLAPVAQAWRERRKIWTLLISAAGPIACVGLGLMLYNALRFDNPFEFGIRYALAGDRLLNRQLFSLRYVAFNFRVYFLELVRWSSQFPFVHDISGPPSPAGYAKAEHCFGILTNIPLVWLALAAPLAWRSRSAEAKSILGGFLAMVAALFGINALTLSLFFGACARYEVDFLPVLMLLAVIGILGLERALALGLTSGQAYRPELRWMARWTWGFLLGFSVAFNLLVSVGMCAEVHNNLGDALMGQDKLQQAIPQYERALQLNPELVQTHNNLGLILLKQGQQREAIRHFEQAVRFEPNYAEAHYNLGFALELAGHSQEAIQHYQQALHLKPDFAAAHYNLGVALEQAGKIEEATAEYRQALCFKPDYAEAHYNLGFVLEWAGQSQEAIQHYEQALHLKPDFAEAHYNLGVSLERSGKIEEAITEYKQALRFKPDYAEAHYYLGFALDWAGRPQEAIQHYEQGLRLKPDFVQAYNNLGVILTKQGRLQEAIERYKQALRLKPDYAEAHYNLGTALERVGRTQEAIEHYGKALSIKPDFAEAQESLARARAVQ